MRAVVITRHGPPEVLEVQERPDPQPGPGQVAIEVHAAGVCFADTMARVGLYPDAPKVPCVVGYEVAGTIAELGEGVDAWRVGDRVIAGTAFGGYAERVVTGTHDVFALPERMSYVEGAAIPVNYATAWAALVDYGGVRPGHKILIHAAAGGVGISATQIAKHLGAEVWGTSSPAKHETIRGFGVDHPIDYTRSGWEREVPKLDLVMDAIGGASFRRSYNLLRPGGRLIAYGASSVSQSEKRNLLTAARSGLRMQLGFNMIKQMSESKTVVGLNMKRLWDDRGTLEQWSAPLVPLIEDGTIHPVIAADFPFDRAADAHRMIAERRNVGKVVLTP